MPLGYFSKCQIKSINVLSKPKPEPKTYVFWGKTSVPYLPSEPNEPNEPNERLCFHQMNQINTYSKMNVFFQQMNSFRSFCGLSTSWVKTQTQAQGDPTRPKNPTKHNETQIQTLIQYILV